MLAFFRSTRMLLFIIVPLLVLLIGCGQQSQGATSSPTPTLVPTLSPTVPPTATPDLTIIFSSLISDNSWHFTFKVNADYTIAGSLQTFFPASFHCGELVLQVLSSGQDPGPWTITNGQFTIKTTTGE